MQREHQIRMDAAGKGGERRRLWLVQRRKADEIPRSRRADALLLFDAPGRLPAGGIVEIQVNAAQVRLPAGGERDLRVLRGNGRRGAVFRAVGRADARDQIRPVRIRQRDQIDHGIVIQLPRRDAVQRAAIQQRLAVGKQPLPERVRRDALVGMVARGDEDLAAAAAELQRPDAAAEGRARERPDVDKRKLPVKTLKIRLLPARGHGNRNGNQVLHEENTLQHIHMPEGIRIFLIAVNFVL